MLKPMRHVVFFLPSPTDSAIAMGSSAYKIFTRSEILFTKYHAILLRRKTKASIA